MAHPSWRASAVGIYRLWRDSGYAIGALISGVLADLFGIHFAIWFVGGLTFLSGVVTAVRQSETLRKPLSEFISPEELNQLIAMNSAVVVDVRSLEEFDSGHVTSAIHREKSTLPSAIHDLPKSSRIITHCGKGGGRSTEAAKLLRENGWENAQWLEGGYMAWNLKNEKQQEKK